MPKFSSPEGFLEMKAEQKAIEQNLKKEQDLQRMAALLPDEYFNSDLFQLNTDREIVKEQEDLIIQTIKTYFNKSIAYNTIPTTNGLAAALNTDRKTLKEMSRKEGRIGMAIRKGYQAIAGFAEEGLLSGKPPQGLVFWLKNNDDWVDAHEVKHDNKTIGEILDDMKQKGELIDGNVITSDNKKVGEIIDSITEEEYGDN